MVQRTNNAGDRRAKSLKNWQKATALIPLALLSGAWTASLAAPSLATAAASSEDPGSLAEGVDVPTEAIKVPASVSVPGTISAGVPDGSAESVISSASANGIPSAALAAYQRAAQVIDAADKSCNIEWPLIAAIGRVESDHGRYGGNTLTSSGVSSPGIYGIPLDGTNGTARITDTDAGQYDDDEIYDRAIGPMQFIPSTWRVVGVDGDGDGKRNPQDIDDAALATAVYLCSGDEDLSTVAGQRSAIYRYNHSNDYVDLVLSIAAAYSDGDYAAVPNGTTSATTFNPSFGDTVVASGTTGYNPPSGGGNGGGDGGGSGGSTDTGGDDGTTDPGDDDGGTPTDPGDGGGTSDPGGTVKDTVDDTVDDVKEVLITTAQAVQLCTNALQAEYGASPAAAVDQCVAALKGKTLKQAQNAVGGVVAGLAGLLDDILGGLLD